MSILNDLARDIARGFASGLASAATNGSRASGRGVALVESACSQLGWGLDERIGSDGVILHFRDSLCVGDIRKVLINCGDAGEVGMLTCYSAAELQPRQVSTEMLAHLLRRNSQCFAAWQMRISDDDTIGFAVATGLLLQGITPISLKALCETVIKEAHDFDAKLHEAGLL